MRTPSTHALCQRCHNHYDKANNAPGACRYHPEAWSGEDSQRWAAPGERPADGGAVSYFYSCCGAEDAPGCCVGPHVSYDEPLPWQQKRAADKRPTEPIGTVGHVIFFCCCCLGPGTKVETTPLAIFSLIYTDSTGLNSKQTTAARCTPKQPLLHERASHSPLGAAASCAAC